MKTDTKEITGITLIDKVLEFTSKTNEESEWTFEKQKDNPPRLIRLQQIDILLKVFLSDIYKPDSFKFNIGNILSGNFILKRTTTDYSNLFIKMDESIAKSDNKNFVQSHVWTLNDLESNYHILINYKRNVDFFINSYWSGCLEISYPLFYALHETSEVAKKIEFKSINEFLGLVIDPLGQIFSKQQLINDMSYPSEDIYDIDLDWI
jgi:hypothetical protein